MNAVSTQLLAELNRVTLLNSSFTNPENDQKALAVHRKHIPNVVFTSFPRIALKTDGNGTSNIKAFPKYDSRESLIVAIAPTNFIDQGLHLFIEV